MNKTEIEEIRLIGLSLKKKTTNEKGQSSIDCGALWQKFESENYYKKIPGKISDEIMAVYHSYEGDHTKPFSYFIGCIVRRGTVVPDGLDSLSIQQGIYKKITASGKMPDCIAKAWQEIWSSDLPRSYQTDFEVYDERSHDWYNAEVDIFVSIK